MARRSHPKVEDLPQELREAVHKKITEGYTYRDIADWITKQGHGISKSAIGKYGKNFLSKLERLRVAREQAKTIVAEAKDGPALEMTEAANQMAVQIILERLINMDDLENAKSTEVLKALALLERSAVQREKLKFDFNRGVDAAEERILSRLQAELAKQPELLDKIAVAVAAAAKEVKQ